MRINVPSFVQTERKNKFIDGFKGVDYSSSPVNIKPYRAAQIKNLVLTDGVLHKRNGWEEFFCPPYETENIVDVISAFDGLFIATFAVPDTIRVYYFKDGETETLLETTSLKRGGLTGRFVKKENEIYFLSDYGRLFTIYRQGDDISLSEIVSAYAPVVSINGGPGEENKRERLDDINLLDVREIIYNPGIPGIGEIVEYVSPVMEKLHYNSSTDYSKNYGLYNEIGSAPFEPAELIGIELTSDFFISSSLKELVSDHFTVTLEIVNDNGKTVSCVSRKVLTNNVDLIPKQVYISDAATFNRANYYGGQMLKFHDANWSDIIPDTDYDAIIARNPNKNLYYLFMNTAALPYLRSPYMRDDDGVFQDNAVVYGYARVTAATMELAGKLEEAYINCIFGSAANENRLFLAKENYVFYSAVNDYTYFPESNVIKCGSPESPVTALCKIADGTLGVSKSISDSGDKSIYYITPILVNKKVNDENVIETESFISKAGATGYGAVNDRCMLNFSDDYVFLADEGLFGIVTQQNISSDVRFMRERSGTINPELMNADLSEACCFSHKNKLYISDGSKTYVADARYRYTEDKDMDDTFNYEWFVWDICAKAFFVFENSLCYISAENKLCKLRNDNIFADVVKVSISANTVGVSVADGTGGYVSAVSRSALDKFEPGDLLDTATVISVDTENSTITFNKPVTSQAAILSQFRAVKAFWESPYIDLGANYLLKTLTGIGIGLEPNYESEVQFSYAASVGTDKGTGAYTVDAPTRGVFKLEDIGSGENAAEFGDLNFGNIAFTVNRFAQNNVKRVRLRNANYVRFAFLSNTKSDCAVNNVMFEYKVIKPLRGVR